MKETVDNLLRSKPGKAYSILRRLGARPGDELMNGTFDLSDHVALNLTPQQSADRIANYFSAVSQEYAALDVNKLSPQLQEQISRHVDISELPQISERDVWEKMKQARVTKSVVTGDIPGKLFKEFSPELAYPVSLIYSNILNTGKWPRKWKVEMGIPIAKYQNPLNEEGIRVISLTPWLSKVFEKFVIEWLMKYIGDKIDPQQFGGAKGVSTTHYLVELVNLIFYNLDFKKSNAVLASAIDFQKPSTD